MKIRSIMKSLWREFLAATAGRPALTTADTLLREVLAAGFWSGDGVCHYCGKFDAKYKTHESHCTAKALTAWAQAQGIKLEDSDNVYPADVPRPPVVLTPPIPLTEEEKAQEAERQVQMLTGLRMVKDLFNHHHVMGPASADADGQSTDPSTP